MEEALINFIRSQWPDAEDVHVEGLAVIAGGYSRETFRFDCHVHRGGERITYPMILRKDPPLTSAILHSSRELEHTLLRRLAEHTNIPVSESYFVAHEPHHFGEPAMVIQRMHGSSEVSALFNGGANAGQAESVATQLCEHIAELHMTDPRLLNPDGVFDDPRGVGIDVSSWDAYIDSMVDYYLRSYDDFAFDPVPVFRDAYLTMRRNKPKPVPVRLVHGDFNPSNFLYHEGNVTAVIDWENAHMGDPREDLGWLKIMDMLSNTDIFGSVKEDGGFLGHYNKITGFDVTEEEVNYFQLFAGANVGVPVISSVKRRMMKEHTELIHLYLTQPVFVAELTFAHLLGYPMPQQGAA